MLCSSDGLWEDLEPSDCMQILKRELKNGKTLEACATAMVDLVCFAFALLAWNPMMIYELVIHSWTRH